MGVSRDAAAAAEENAGAPLARLTSLQFGLLCAKDVRKISVFEQTHGLTKENATDSRLGLSIQDEHCSTCGAMSLAACPGHFGHIDLATPVYNTLQLQKLKHILEKICLSCGEVRKKRTTKGDVANAQRMMDNPVQHVKKESSRTMYVILDEEEVCKFCTAKGRYPAPKVRIVQKAFKLPNKKKSENVDVLSLEYPQYTSKEIPEDYWNFLNHDKEGPVHYLHPSEIVKILKKISTDGRKALGIEPIDGLVLQTLPIPPNCIRVPDVPRETHQGDASTSFLNSLIKANNAAKVAKKSNFLHLQLIISNYLRVKGAPKVKGNSEPTFKKKYVEVDSGPKWFQKKCAALSKSTDFCGRAVLTGDPQLDIDEIGIPVDMAAAVTMPEHVTVFNREKLQKLVNAAETGREIFIQQAVILFRNEIRKLEIGDIVHRPIQDGDVVYANRTPSLHKHSIISFKVKLQSCPTVSVNPLICSPFGADFDGDCFHIYFPQSLQSRTEAEEVMGIRHQLIDSQGGDLLISLTQDLLLAAYLLTFDHKFFRREEIQQLGIASLRKVMTPAIIKSPKGSFWTGLQVYSLLLPLGLNFEGCIRDGELLQVGLLPGFLKTSRQSLVYRMYETMGVQAVEDYLNAASKVLTELHSLRGFSISWEDLSPSNEMQLRSELHQVTENIFKKANTQLEMCSLVEDKSELLRHKLQVSNFKHACGSIDQLTRKLLKPRNSVCAMIDAGSKGSVSNLRQQVACLGPQLYRGNTLKSFIRDSYRDGLSTTDFFDHCTASRDSFMKQRLSDPGTLKKDMMGHLGDVYLAYDGTVRYRKNQQIIRFSYRDGGELRDEVAGDALGVLAAMSVAQEAYQTVLSSSDSSCVDCLKEILLTQESSNLKEYDQVVYVRPENCEECAESIALTLQHHLQKISLETITRSIEIEWKTGGWTCKFHLSKETMERSNLLFSSVAARIEEAIEKDQRISDAKGKKKLSLTSHSERLSLWIACSDEDNYSDNSQYDDTIADGLKILKEKILPILLQVLVSGKETVLSTKIVWEDEQQLSAVAATATTPQVVVKVNMATNNRGGAYAALMDASIPIAKFIDWNRTAAFSVQEVCATLGIEAAYRTVHQRLKLIMDDLDVEMDDAHLSLIGDFITHTGQVIGFTATGLDKLLTSIKASDPLLEAWFHTPVTKLSKAAAEGAVDNLDGLLSSTMWGMCPRIGTGSDFELLWQDKNIPYDAQGKDAHEFLAYMPKKVVPTSNVDDTDLEACASPLNLGEGGDVIGNEPSVGEDGWGGTSTGWDDSSQLSEQVTQVADGWGDAAAAAAVASQSSDGFGNTSMQAAADGWNDTTVVVAAAAAAPSNPASTTLVDDGWGDDSTAADVEMLDESVDRVVDVWMTSIVVEEEERGRSEEVDNSHQRQLTPTCANLTPVGSRRDFGRQEDPIPMDIDTPQLVEETTPKPFKPTGANIIPLGTRRRFAFGTQDSCTTIVEETTVEVNATEIPESSTVTAAPVEEESRVEIPEEFEALMDLLTSGQRILRTYEVGDRLSEEDEEFVKEKLLPYHPKSAMKIGCGIDYIKVDNPPVYPESKCMFVVRSDDSSEDFSYLKCLNGWVHKTFPSHLAVRASRYLTRRRRQAPEGSQPSDVSLESQPSDVPMESQPSDGPLESQPSSQVTQLTA